MSKQYDSIGAAYDSINKMPAQLIQEDAMRAALFPIAPYSRVLDLACGLGNNSQNLISWGAAHVTAIDISAAMISGAKEALPADMKDRVSFHVADCGRPEMWKLPELKGMEGTFDIVLAAWFLNYAASLEEMQSMFENIHKALKPGGKLVAITVNPAVKDLLVPNDPANEDEKHYGTIYEVVETLENRKTIRLLTTRGPKIQFEFYSFGFDVYRDAAAAAGMGKLNWVPIMPSQEHLDRLGAKYWNSHIKRPRPTICLATKPLGE